MQDFYISQKIMHCSLSLFCNFNLNIAKWAITTCTKHYTDVFKNNY